MMTRSPSLHRPHLYHRRQLVKLVHTEEQYRRHPPHWMEYSRSDLNSYELIRRRRRQLRINQSLLFAQVL